MEYHASIEASHSGDHPQVAFQSLPFTDVLTIYDKNRIPKDIPMTVDSITIGRTDHNDITLSDKAISRNHVRIDRKDDGWYISDLGSTNGILFGKSRIVANKEIRWSPDSKVNLGPFQMRWQRHHREGVDERTIFEAPDANGVAPYGLQDDHLTHDQHDADIVEMSIISNRPIVASGEALNVTVNMLNLGGQTADYHLYIDGIPHHWVEIDSDVIRLEPSRDTHFYFSLLIPESDQAIRGTYDSQVVLESMVTGEIVSSVDGQFTIEEMHDFELLARQKQDKDGAICDIAILNRGNSADFYNVSAASSDGVLQFDARQWQLALTPATQDHLRIIMRPTKKPMIGPPSKVPYVLTATSNSGIEKNYYGNMTIEPTFTSRKLGAICIAVLALSALMWFALQYFPRVEVTTMMDAMFEIVRSSALFSDGTFEQIQQLL